MQRLNAKDRSLICNMRTHKGLGHPVQKSNFLQRLNAVYDNLYI